MRREYTFALIFGVILGSLIFFGILRVNKTLNKSVSQEEVPSSQTTKDKEINPVQTLTLISPVDGGIVTQNPIKFSGIAERSTPVVISGKDTDFIITSQENGSFEKEVEIDEGVNQFQIVNFNQNGEKKEIRITVVYSPEFAKYEVDNEKSSGEDPLRQKIQLKIEEVRKKPKAILGTIIDKGQNFIQIKNTQDEINLISILDDTNFTKPQNKNPNISFSDVAIGDFAAVLGYPPKEIEGNGESNNLFQAKRILIIPEIKPLRLNITLGSVSLVEKKKVIIKDFQGQEISLSFPRKWQGPEIEGLKNEDKIIAIGEGNPNSFLIRTIHKIQ